MKKLIIAVICGFALVAATVSSYGQTGVVFNNGSATAITNAFTGEKIFGPAGTYDFGLYMGAYGDTSLSQMTLIKVTKTPFAASPTSFNAGLFSPTNVALPPDFLNSTKYAFQIAGWRAAYGNDFFTAANADPEQLWGISDLGYVTTSQLPGGPYPVLMGQSPGQVGGFELGFIPEPGTIVLGGLGAVILLLFRRLPAFVSAFPWIKQKGARTSSR
ncbi:MAG TPA: PEP-CTERM sorting domain-containing protein [Verrucomicrobiae bacterium]|nr:PEP-CTERM sorting domain-containing protein [Verrucomicrobiae bacterium]